MSCPSWSRTPDGRFSPTPTLFQRYGVRSLGILTEPITLEEARTHLRVDIEGSPPMSADDAWIEDIGIPAARDWCEHFLGRSIAQQTLELAGNGFPSGFSARSGRIALPFGPVQLITSVVYLDSDGVEQTMSDTDYSLDQYEPQSLTLDYGASWPATQDFANSVKVRYVTGYNVAGDSPQTYPLPAGIRAAMLLMLGHLFVNRETTIAGPSVSIAEIPLGAAALLERYRLRLSMA